MKSTVSVSWNDGQVAREHNERDEELCKYEGHIDLNNEHGDSFHEVVYRSNLNDAYASIFGDAIEEYNSKQKRKDRKLSVDSYIQSIEDDTRGNPKTKRINGKRVADKDASHKGKRISYEITAKVGNITAENGKRNEELPRELQREIIEEYCKTFQGENPNFRVINIDIHGDEGFYDRNGAWVYGGIHPHIEFVPVASGFKQGLFVQNSMNKAMKAMGFEGSDCYHQWAEKEQKRLEDITKVKYRQYAMNHTAFAKKYGYTFEVYHPVADKTRQGGLSKEDYIREQKIQEDFADVLDMKNSLDIEKQECVNIYNDLQNQKQECDARENALKARERVLMQKVQEDAQREFEAREKILNEREDAFRKQQERVIQEHERKLRELEQREKKVSHLERVDDAVKLQSKTVSQVNNNRRMPKGFENW